MSIAKEYQLLIEKRAAIQGDVDYDTAPVIRSMIQLMTKNMDETINFLDNDCTEEQFVWLSEIFDEIAEQSQSRVFINALRRTAEKYPTATKKYHISFFIDSAEEFIE